MITVLLLIGAYLLGSIPSAVWIGKRFYGIDVREHGSRNAGATNTLRVLGRKAAVPVFIIDFLIGFVAVKLSLLAPHYADYQADSVELFTLQITLIVAVVLGHIFPVFAKFKGGKGVATLAGTVLSMATFPLLLSMLTFFIILALSHYVSLSSITAGISFPLYLAFIFHEDEKMVGFGIVVAIVLLITHRKNIRRLLNGTESKIYLFKKKSS